MNYLFTFIIAFTLDYNCCLPYFSIIPKFSSIIHIVFKFL